MTKSEYLAALKKALRRLSDDKKEEVCAYAMEMIEDRMEGGLTELEAVASMEAPDVLARGFLENMDTVVVSFLPAVHSWGMKILLVLGFPLWGTLLLMAGVLILAAVILMGCVPLVCSALTIGLSVTGIVSSLASPLVMFQSGSGVGLLQLGAGLTCIGLAILTAFGASYSWQGMKSILARGKAQLTHILYRKEIR